MRKKEGKREENRIERIKEREEKQRGQRTVHRTFVLIIQSTFSLSKRQQPNLIYRQLPNSHKILTNSSLLTN